MPTKACRQSQNERSPSLVVIVDAAELGVPLVAGLLHADPVGGLVLQRGVRDGAVGQPVEVFLAVALHAVVHDVVLGGQQLGELHQRRSLAFPPKQFWLCV